MIKFTDEFIEAANYLYQLAEKFSDLSINYLDESKDKSFIKRLNVIFQAKFNTEVSFLSDGYHQSILIPALKNYLIGLSCLNENALVCNFLDCIKLS